MKIIVAMYSTFVEPGWKSARLKSLVERLEKESLQYLGIGLNHIKDKKINNHKLVLYKLPIIVSDIIKLIARFFKFIPGYYAYLAGELVLGLLAANKIKTQKNSIVYCKPRPFAIIQKALRNGNKILLEHAEMHPQYSKEKIDSEYEKYSIDCKYIYTSSYAVDEALKSIDAADKIILMSKACYNSFVDFGVPKSKLLLARPNTHVSLTNSYNSNKPFAFISTGYHSFTKGTHQLLLAWQDAGIENSNLILVGDLQDDLKQFISKFGPFNNVIYAGYQNVANFYEKYRAVGVLNSICEAYPRTVLEYLANGYPVIVSECATCDIEIDNICGFVVNNKKELVNALVKLNNHRDLYDYYSNNAHKLMEHRDINSYEDHILNIIQEMEC